MNGTPSLRRAVLVLLALVTLLATAGCVNLPANTSVNVVRNPAKGGSGVDVRIWPQAPQRGATPVQIVEGFLQTAASDLSNLPIAQDYLTGEAASNWHPKRVVVFSDVSSPKPVLDSADVRVQVTGTEVATVSDNGAYQQVLNPVKDAAYTFDLTLDANNNYRIDRLPGVEFGILLTQDRFRANYAAYYLYYLNHAKPDASMIPVPDYQRSQAGDAATAQNLIDALVKGPPDPLAGIASLAAPNVALAGAVTISPNNTASVPIKSPNNCATDGRSTCELLADELLATLSNLASVSSVVLVDAQGNPLVPSSSMDSVVDRYHLAVSGAKSAQFYYLDSHTAQVERFDSATATSNAGTPEPIGPPTRKYSQLAVGDVVVGNASPQTYAAVVDDKGSKLYVSTPGSAKDSAPVYTGTHISSLSWDSFGHLWFLDTAKSSVLVYRVDVTAEPDPVVEQVPVVGDGEYAINRIAVAPDGLRIAVSYTSSLASSALYSVAIGVVTDSGAGIEANLSFGIDQPVVYGWTPVYDVGWHGSQTLVVLGSASSSSPVTLAELNTDGSPVIGAADLNPVAFNPPTGTSNVEWNGSVLLAATHSGSGATQTRQIEQYSFTNSTWTSSVTSGFSPSYVN